MSKLTEAAVAAGVRATIGAHTQAQDAGRTDDVVALYTDDAVLELPGADPIQGHVGLKAAFDDWAPQLPQLHLVGNTTITSWSDDRAIALSDAAFFQRGETGWAVQVVGHYNDTFDLVDGAWKISRRVTTYQI